MNSFKKAILLSRTSFTPIRRGFAYKPSETGSNRYTGMVAGGVLLLLTTMFYIDNKSRAFKQKNEELKGHHGHISNVDGVPLHDEDFKRK